VREERSNNKVEEGISMKSSSEQTERSWVAVQAGLFEYPVEEGRLPALLANQCTKCGRSYFPKRAFCPQCFDQEGMEDITLDRRGIIYACTVVRVPSPVGIKAPYAYGYVDIPAHQVRVYALFTGGDPSSFRPGQEVGLVVEPIRVNEKGQEVIGYKFKAAT
jgi:uncharacterized OB-fold protein